MSKKTHKTSVGGQALIEGVMMQGPRGMATAVRKPDGEILTKYHTIKLLRNKNKFFNIPIIRGIFGFVESMIMGYKTLMYSAEVSGMEDFKEESMSKFERWLNDKMGEKLVSAVAAIGSVLGIVLAFILFFYLPVLVFNKANEWAGGAITNFQGLIEGGMKIIIFVIYIAAVSRMKDVRRLFMYHGAEHKSIACYEAGLDLTVENAKKCTRFHPRCGTSFIFVVLIFSIIFYTIIAKIFPVIAAERILWLILKLVFLPIIMGICYEFIRYAGRHDNLFVKIVSAPGLWMQRLTTKEPTDDILEVGIAAIKAVITDNPEDDEIK